MTRRTSRFYAKDVTTNAVIIGEDELHHIKNALRLRGGDEVTVFTDSGQEYKAVFTGNNMLRILSKLKSNNGKVATITCASAIPKGKRSEFMVQKLCELGLHKFTPTGCERSVVKVTNNKINRLKRVALEASKQCGRADITDISDEISFVELCSTINCYDLAYMATISADKLLVKFLLELKKEPSSVLFIIGPEGGFTADEEQLAIKSGAVPAKLSRNILRVETAAITAMATIIQGLGIQSEKVFIRI